MQVFLDSQRGAVSAVEARLQEVEELAHKNGHAIGEHTRHLAAATAHLGPPLRSQGF